MNTCTPLWVAVLLTLLTLVGTHRLTSWREQSKTATERKNRWIERMRIDLKAIVAAAVAHYCDPARLNTALSAAGIMGDLRRLRMTIPEARFVKAIDHKYLTEALVTLNEKVTGLPGFQDDSRQALPANDAAIDEIMEAEQYVLDVCSRRQS